MADSKSLTETIVKTHIAHTTPTKTLLLPTLLPIQTHILPASEKVVVFSPKHHDPEIPTRLHPFYLGDKILSTVRKNLPERPTLLSLAASQLIYEKFNSSETSSYLFQPSLAELTLFSPTMCKSQSMSHQFLAEANVNIHHLQIPKPHE